MQFGSDNQAGASRQMLYPLFGDDATAHSLTCTIKNKPVGFAVFFFNYSTWLGKRNLFLVDLYILPEQRGS